MNIEGYLTISQISLYEKGNMVSLSTANVDPTYFKVQIDPEKDECSFSRNHHGEEFLSIKRKIRFPTGFN